LVIYNVRSGDSLYSIAKKFAVPSQYIVSINGLTQIDNLVVGMELVIPVKSVYDSPLPKTSIETLGYYSPPSYESALSLVDNMGQSFTYLGIYYYNVTASGEIVEGLDSNTLKIGQIRNITILPVLVNLVNNGFDPQLARTLLSNTVTLNNFINNILKFIQKYNLKGINIDFENLYPADRNLFTRFIRLLSQALHKYNKILVVNMAPKFDDWPERDWAGFFDYNAIGPYIDIAAIMTYEWGWREGPPRPTAPINYVKQALDYAIANNIPANKILLGMTLYGYDWTLPTTINSVATTVTLPGVWDLARKHNGSIHFDQGAKQPYMTYIDYNNKNHLVWFEDALSHYYKYQLVKDYHLRGAFYWTISLPFQSTWYMLSFLFNIKKLV
jgi:spore germination protein